MTPHRSLLQIAPLATIIVALIVHHNSKKELESSVSPVGAFEEE